MLKVSSKILDAIEKAKESNVALANCYVRVFNTSTDQNTNIDIKFELIAPTENDKQFKLRNIVFIIDHQLFATIGEKTLYFEDGKFIFTAEKPKHTQGD